MTTLRRALAALVTAIAFVLGASSLASAAALGTVTVAYNPNTMSYSVTPSSLTGGAGDTFTLANTMISVNAWISLVDATGQATGGASSCTADSLCNVIDGGGSATGTFTVVAPGTFTIRRTLNNGASFTTLGTLTITSAAPTPTPTPAITVTGVSPASGLTTGGESITITGSGFSGGSAPTVSLGGAAATAVTVVSDTRITATTPARAAGAVDVTVSRDGGTGTRAGAYTYLQVYWLTVTNSQPPGTGASTAKSTGAVTTSGGTWASTQTKESMLFFTRTEYKNFAGGINCGNRVERKTLFGGFNFLGSETVWDGGPCRYAFPAGTRVALSALPSSATSLFPGFFEDHWAGLFNKWTGACTGTTSECIVTMNADRSTRATWGRFAWGLISGTATATPVFADDGSLSYSVLTVAFVPQANAVTGTPTYSMVSTFTTGASAAARDTAARQLSACRGAARASGRGLEARCTPTPALAAALRKGPVRVTTKWYLRAPRQKATYPLGQARAHLANRRAGAVTG